MKAWNVYLRGRHVDTVYFQPDCNHDYVKTSLIEHDGYNPGIVLHSA